MACDLAHGPEKCLGFLLLCNESVAQRFVLLEKLVISSKVLGITVSVQTLGGVLLCIIHYPHPVAWVACTSLWHFILEFRGQHWRFFSPAASLAAGLHRVGS